mmetsp:Transcript_55280/g.103668  ORF Transcript_55280/g.103668 Transcript_55280/m.103668 type:complete len:161 (+) Transcript_55280:69-551(+)
MYSEQDVRMQQYPYGQYGAVPRSERSICCDKQPQGSLPGSFPPPQGTFMAMETGYLGPPAPLSLGAPMQPPQGVPPFPVPTPGGAQSSATYGGYGVNPFLTGSMRQPHPAYNQYGYSGYHNIQKGYAPGGYYGHGAMNSIIAHGYHPMARRGRTRRSGCC